MRRAGALLGAVAVAGTASVIAVVAASGHASANDAAATHSYLEARLVAQRMPAGHSPAEPSAIGALAEGVKVECPGVLHAEPESARNGLTGGEISREISDAIFGASERVGHAADERFYKSVRRLRWSNPRLTKLLHDLALEQAEQSGIPAPPLCADLKFWVASRYTATTAATKRYLHRHDVISGIATIAPEPGEKPFEDFLESDRLVAHRLARYEDPADRLLAKKVFPSKNASFTGPAGKQFLAAFAKVDEALGRHKETTS
jgi:hypothetical protein